MDLWQEYAASDEAITYLRETQDHTTEISAYRILCPAYGTYAGSYLFPPIGTVAGALIGHGVGRAKAAAVQRRYDRLDAEKNAAMADTPPTAADEQPVAAAVKP